MPASLSVVIPHYGAAETTIPLITQLSAQADNASQLIVVDDCSPIPFPAMAGVEVLRRTRNGGFGSAVNSGAEVATGEWLLILNSDLDVPPTFLTDLAAAAQGWMPAVVSPAVTNPEGVPDYTARRFPTARQQAIEWLTPLARYRDTAWWRHAIGLDPVLGHPAPCDWLVGAALLLPLAEFRAVGGFDEGYFMNAEETDLQRRLRARGIPSVRLPQVHVTHIGGGSSDPAKRRGWVVASRARYAQKWGGHTRLRMALTAATGANLAWNGVRAALGRRTRPLATAREEFNLIWSDHEPR